MLGSLEFFNALVVTVVQKPESCCPVLDILVSFMAPALEVKFRGVLFLAKARQSWHEKISRSCPRQSYSCRIHGLPSAVALRLQIPSFFAVPLITSPIRSMAELAALGAPFELSNDDSWMVGYTEVIPKPRSRNVIEANQPRTWTINAETV
jgi:hypothetical protein